ncbi:ABCG26, partial [Symbiodinium sp. KB8]
MELRWDSVSVEVAGSVTVDGVARHKGSSSTAGRKLSKQTVAFVTQEDTMLTQLTVFETLWYASTVRLPGSRVLLRDLWPTGTPLAHKERLARVREVIKRMGLAKVAHTRVGTDMERGLSGGERKRLNVAQELLTDPAVLLAD